MGIHYYKSDNFMIKTNSTLPELRYKLSSEMLNYYNITIDMLENVAITFSMINSDNGNYVIANTGCDLIYSNINKCYELVYRFNLDDTSSPGRYYGEFKIDFLGNGLCGKITLPIDSYINILIVDSITKTTVI